MRRHKLSIYCLTIAWFSLCFLFIGCPQGLLFAQDSSQSDSLAIPEHDPLLVPIGLNRDLSPLEKKRIRAEIVELEKQAQGKFDQGDRREAFLLWFRQLRLYRAVDLNAEIKALGNVGEIAWQNNLGAELRVINQRLDAIALKSENGSDQSASVQNSDNLIALGNAFQQIRDLNQAIATYKQLLTQARQLDDIALEQKHLNTLGKLYLGKFSYLEAAKVYQELLQLSQLQANATLSPSSDQVAKYYLQLSQIYNYLQQPEQAIVVKEELIEHYKQQNQSDRLGAVRISLGTDYQALENFPLAIANYTEAEKLGTSTNQLSLASEALSKLSSLYLQAEKYDLAIATTQDLIANERQANNSYGVLTAYERLGKIYLQLENFPQALNTFNQALNLAYSLDYQVDYFTDLVENLQAKVNQ